MALWVRLIINNKIHLSVNEDNFKEALNLKWKIEYKTLDLVKCFYDLTNQFTFITMNLAYMSVNLSFIIKKKNKYIYIFTYRLNAFNTFNGCTHFLINTIRTFTILWLLWES